MLLFFFAGDELMVKFQLSLFLELDSEIDRLRVLQLEMDTGFE